MAIAQPIERVKIAIIFPFQIRLIPRTALYTTYASLANILLPMHQALLIGYAKIAQMDHSRDIQMHTAVRPTQTAFRANGLFGMATAQPIERAKIAIIFRFQTR